MDKRIKIYNKDNIQVMKQLKDESIDIICIDPPYLYLQGQELERPFDEKRFFQQCKRLLTKNGFIIMFGRGDSFYKRNVLLAELGFKFKEEIIWEKDKTTSPVTALARKHESISIFSKNKGVINRVKIPYIEAKQHNLDSIVQDIKRLISAIKKPKTLQLLLEFLKNNPQPTAQNKIIRTDIISEHKEKWGVSVKGTKDFNKDVTALLSVHCGCNESSIIRLNRDHYATLHPTQKPIRLLERLLALAVPKQKAAKDIVVADFFAGSMSTIAAAYNLGFQAIGTEIHPQYFKDGQERLKKLLNTPQTKTKKPIKKV